MRLFKKKIIIIQECGALKTKYKEMSGFRYWHSTISIFHLGNVIFSVIHQSSQPVLSLKIQKPPFK